ncbi:MAG: CPBP family intramembrane glutamic endopeptidase [Gemmatimonadota bacterium]
MHTSENPPSEEAGHRQETPAGGGEPRPPSPPDPGPEPSPDLPDEVRRFLRRGLLLYPLVVVVLWTWTELGLLNALLLGALMELLPVLAVAQVPLVGKEKVDRPSAYIGSAIAILFLGWVSLVLGGDQVGYEAMGMTPLSWSDFLLWTGIALGGGLALMGVSHLVEKALGFEESEVLKQILPRTRHEKSLFAGVSLSAGLGEELAYRAYAIPVLATLVGSTWGAAVLSSGIFGFLHAYQGGIGVVRTGVLGFALAAVFLLSGSVWPVIVAHTAIDLIGGLVLGPRLLEEEED